MGSPAVISLSLFSLGFWYLEAGFIVLNIYVHRDATHMWLSYVSGISRFQKFDVIRHRV